MKRKQIKARLDNRDKILHDQIASIGVEKEEADNASLHQEGPVAPDIGDALDDLLSFDVHVLASNTRAVPITNEANKSVEEHLNADGELHESAMLVHDDKSDLATEPLLTDLEYSDNHSNTHDTSTYATKFAELEFKIATLVEALDIQVDMSEQHEQAINRLQKLIFIGLLIGGCALLVSLGIGVFSVNSLSEHLQANTHTNDHTLAAQLDSDMQMTKALQELEGQSDDAAQIVIVPEEDLAEINDDNNGQQLAEGANEASNLQQKDETGKAIQSDGVQLQILGEEQTEEWFVNLYAYPQRAETDEKIAELKQKGIAAEVFNVTVRGETWFRVRVPGFKSQSEAEDYVAKIKMLTGDDAPWVSKQYAISATQ